MITTTIIVLWQDNIKDLSSWQLVVVEQKLSLVALPHMRGREGGSLFCIPHQLLL
jgi:hypothetical protein